MSGRRVYDPALTEPHLGNAFTIATIREFDRTLGEASVDLAIEEAGLSREYLADPDRWASLRFYAGLIRGLARRAGFDGLPPYEDPFWQHWRRGSWRIADAEVGHFLWLEIWAMERPSCYFAAIERLYQTANQLTRARLVDQGEGWSRIELRESPDHETCAAACWSRRGHFEKIPQIWGLPMARIEHARCRHRDPGVDTCDYTIRYDEAVGLSAAAELARVAALLRNQLPVVVTRHRERFLEHRRALLAQRKIASYLPPNALRALELDPERELALGGHRCDGAILFADIVGFTRRFATDDAEAVVDHLNLYYEAMDAVIAAHGGIVDKRMGDGIMVVFVAVEAPRSLASLAASAVRCGLAMLQAVPGCSDVIVARGGAPLAIRVGVGAGSLIQGNLGSSQRMEYTVIGEPVNLAARLQTAARVGRLLTTAECLVDEPALAVRGEARRVTAKGIGEIEVVELDPD